MVIRLILYMTLCVTDHARIIPKTSVNSDIAIRVPSFVDGISFNFQSISTIVYLVLRSCVLFILLCLLCSLLMCFYLCVVSVPNSMYIRRLVQRNGDPPLDQPRLHNHNLVIISSRLLPSRSTIYPRFNRNFADLLI